MKGTEENILEVIFQETGEPVLIRQRHPRTTSGSEVYLHVGNLQMCEPLQKGSVDLAGIRRQFPEVISK